MKAYKVGQIIEGNVTGIEKYGIFVNIDNFHNGLIHISEISDGFVRNVNDYVAVGETIYVKVIEIDDESLQLKLSIKDINYKNNKGLPKIEESPNGFKPLADKLPEWVDEKIKELNEN